MTRELVTKFGAKSHTLDGGQCVQEKETSQNKIDKGTHNGLI